MILPLCVFGNSAAKRIAYGPAMAPIFFATGTSAHPPDQGNFHDRLERDKGADHLSLKPR